MEPDDSIEARFEDAALRMGSKELESLAADRYKADSLLMDGLFNLIEDHWATCDSLISRRIGCDSASKTESIAFSIRSLAKSQT